MRQILKQVKLSSIQQGIAKLGDLCLKGGLYLQGYLITPISRMLVTTKQCSCHSQNNNENNSWMGIGISKKGLRLLSLIVMFMLLNLLIFLAIGLSLGHVTMGMGLTVLLYGLLSVRLNNSLCTGNCTCQKS